MTFAEKRLLVVERREAREEARLNAELNAEWAAGRRFGCWLAGPSRKTHCMPKSRRQNVGAEAVTAGEIFEPAKPKREHRCGLSDGY